MPLSTKAKHIRQDIVRILAKKGGQTASNLSAADILTTLYFTTLKFHPQRMPTSRIVVSQNLQPAWHSAMAHSGYLSKKDLFANKELPSGAPHGHSLHIAIGRAIASNKPTYCIITDSELQEGSLWEAAALAGSRKTSNLTLIVDRNNLDANGFMNIEPVRKKLEAFNWKVIEVDGHNTDHIAEALQERNTLKPTAILAHTIPGKGVSFIENNPEWHEKTPTKEEEQKAIIELR
jgi:transketolase